MMLNATVVIYATTGDNENETRKHAAVTYASDSYSSKAEQHAERQQGGCIRPQLEGGDKRLSFTHLNQCNSDALVPLGGPFYLLGHESNGDRGYILQWGQTV